MSPSKIYDQVIQDNQKTLSGADVGTVFFLLSYTHQRCIEENEHHG